MDIIIQTRSNLRQRILQEFGAKYAKFLKIDKKSATLYIALRKDVGDTHQSEGLTLGFDSDVFVYLQSSLSTADLLRTLAHEMVHVKQLLLGQLKHKAHRGRVDTYWCGRKNNKKYLEQPWEVEAFAKESLLFRKAVDQILKVK
jgi:hypothetical protein